MASYRIAFKPSVEKDLRSLPASMVVRAIGQIESLGSDPFPRQSIKLAGAERLYRLRIGDYRVVYQVDTDIRQITIHYVRHRRNAYRQL